MKKISTILIILTLLCGSFCGCDTQMTSGSNTKQSSVRTSTVTTSIDPEASATRALYLHFLAYADIYDAVPEKTKYTITSTESRGSNGWWVYGKYWLYDKYGECVRSDKFKVSVNSNGHGSVEEF